MNISTYLTPYWNNFADFLAMGNYGFYVWGSFLMVAIIMIFEIIIIKKNYQKTIHKLKLLNENNHSENIENHTEITKNEK